MLSAITTPSDEQFLEIPKATMLTIFISKVLAKKETECQEKNAVVNNREPIRSSQLPVQVLSPNTFTGLPCW